MTCARLQVQSGELRFFIDVTHADLVIRESSAEGFLRRCDSFNEQHVRVNTGQPRVKIAVLDTGFNKCGIRGFIDNIKTSRKADRDFSEPIAGTKSFFETSSLEDECGHGTRVLSLLLRVAPNADYHVAKVSRTLQDNDPDAISRVVEVCGISHKRLRPLVDTF